MATVKISVFHYRAEYFISWSFDIIGLILCQFKNSFAETSKVLLNYITVHKQFSCVWTGWCHMFYDFSDVQEYNIQNHRGVENDPKVNGE